MKFFIDTADLDEAREAMSWGALSGMTTNPNPYVKTGRRLANFEQRMVKIREIRGGLSVSAESTVAMMQEVVEEDKRLTGLAPNVVAKLPISVESLAVTKTPAEDSAVVNMTLVLPAPRALPATRAGVRYISPFVGRVDDIGSDGVASFKEIVRCIHNYDFGYECETIAASIRSPYHVTAAALTSTDIATVPLGALKNYVRYPLTARGLAKFETGREKVKNAQAGV